LRLDAQARAQLGEVAAQAEADLEYPRRFEDRLERRRTAMPGRTGNSQTRCSVASWIRCGPVETSPLAKVGFASVSKPSTSCPASARQASAAAAGVSASTTSAMAMP
jgi:hypothetical protein